MAARPCRSSATAPEFPASLLDRIDIQVEVPGLRHQELATRNPGEASALIRQRVNAARARQLKRFEKRNIHANAHMGSKDIKRYCAVKQGAKKLLETAIDKTGLSAYSRVLKVSLTIVDLEGSEEIKPNHISEAIQYRSLDRRM